MAWVPSAILCLVLSSAALAQTPSGTPSVVVRGALGASQVRRAFAEARQAAGACFEIDLRAVHRREGRVDWDLSHALRFVVGADGQVSAVATARSALGVPESDACAERAFQAVRAPSADGPSVVLYRFRLGEVVSAATRRAIDADTYVDPPTSERGAITPRVLRPDTPPPIRYVRLEVRGPRSRAAIRSAVTGALTSCFSNDRVEGVQLSFRVAHPGETSAVRVTTESASVGECVARRLREMRLPSRSEGGATRVSLSLEGGRRPGVLGVRVAPR